MTYDSKTENGIPYISGLYHRSFEYEVVVDDLDAIFPVRREAISGRGTVQTYTVAARSVTRNNMDFRQLMSLWDSLMARKLALEGAGSPRKAVGVLIRDW